MSMLLRAPKIPAPPPAPPAAPARIVNPYQPVTTEDAQSGDTIMPDEPVQAATVAEEERRKRSRRRGRASTLMTGGSGLMNEAQVYRPGLSLLSS